MELSIIHYFALISSPVFLFGSIKLGRIERSIGTTLLTIGFSQFTLTAILDVTQYLEIITCSYHPYMESSYYFHQGGRFEPWERFYYWGKLLVRWIGYIVVAIGFIIEGRRILAKLREDERQLPTP